MKNFVCETRLRTANFFGLLLNNQKRSETPRVATVRLVFSYHHAQFGPTASIMTTTERKPLITKQLSSVSELILIATLSLNFGS